MWLYPLPAILALIGFVFVLFSRTNSLLQVRYAVLILVTGTLLYGVRAWRRNEWPFGRQTVASEESTG
jgi:hypothetical protein